MCVYKREITYSQDKINPVHDSAYSTTTYQINKHMEMKKRVRASTHTRDMEEINDR